MLLGERDAFIVDERGVLDGSDSGADGVLDAFRCVCVSLDAKSEVVRFIDGGMQFFGSEFKRLGVAPVSEHGAGGKNLDVVGAAVRELTDSLPNFPRAVGFSITKIQGELNIPRQPGHRPGAFADRNVGAGDKHARADDVPAGNGVAHGDIVERAIDADVAHGREAA